MLSIKALKLIKLIFGKESNLQFPAAVAEEIIEIRKWAEKQTEKEEKQTEKIEKDKPQNNIETKNG